MRMVRGLAALAATMLACAASADARVVVPVERAQVLARGHVEPVGEGFVRGGRGVGLATLRPLD